MSTATESDTRAAAAEDAVRRLVGIGRAELDAIERAAAAEKERKAAEDRIKRSEVIRQVKAAIVADGQVPAELFPYMRPNGLEDDGRCPNGYVTVTVGLPGYPEDAYVAFNVHQGGNPGQWYVKGEWIAVGPRGEGTVAYPTFAQAVAAEAAATERVPL